jgi:hypothetical protein
VLFDPEGKEIGHAKWLARLEIAWALTSFAGLPEEEAQEIERQLTAEWEAKRFVKRNAKHS